jgi:hypothetical protein
MLYTHFYAVPVIRGAAINVFMYVSMPSVAYSKCLGGSSWRVAAHLSTVYMKHSQTQLCYAIGIPIYVLISVIEIALRLT